MDDNKYVKWCIVRYLHLADHYSAKIRKIDEQLTAELDFEDIWFRFPFKIEDIHKIKKIILLALVFLVMKIWKSIQPIYQKNKKWYEDKHVVNIYY